MISKNIQCKDEQELLKLVNIVNHFPYMVDVSIDHYVVDAKSILGMMSLGTGNVMRMDIHEEEAEDLLEALKAFIV